MVVSITLLFGAVLLFWVDWVLIQFAWINMYDGLFSIASNSLLPLLGIIAMAGACSLVLIGKRLKAKGVRYRLKSVVLACALIAITGMCASCAHSLSSTALQVTSVVSIGAKEVREPQHFLVIKEPGTENPIRITCDENTYSRIIIDENVLYTIEYRLNLFESKSGNLYHIDLDDYVDNRKTADAPPSVKTAALWVSAPS